MFTEPEENNWFRIIAQVLLNSVVNAVINKSIGAAIKKFSAPAIIISCKVIIVRNNAILSQSEHAYLYNQLSNNTKRV